MERTQREAMFRKVGYKNRHAEVHVSLKSPDCVGNVCGVVCPELSDYIMQSMWFLVKAMFLDA